ncbi:nitroimidazol reductase NimA-like FMN-containing flavoprotein (pyridoxamine 5'-phosphate oxidase superfamily) [Streptomyces sp. LBL]|uniref:helix-turn-helix domain-containing protein n=1 Tax=Streptomyces sp. LBL TaxID=2940562 RepID=UPI002475483C|nr:pyridoxamine 5'-phosphate oxidase family protein [Streptomyces sp. LBL]MDH6622494.1 nitroimidazol reductase NimA-like FMN-containing flavoprotein (pyridoxamine 5'-phosphate oxidase superfamily) [Streptomyces sp. LBL]
MTAQVPHGPGKPAREDGPVPGGKEGTADRPPRGDLGRRIARRRTERGLTRREAALRAEMAPGYLRYLEEQPGAAPDRGVLLRLAGVLGTTVSELAGGDVDLPPGPGRAARHIEFTELTEQECRDLLGTHGVGRLALTTPAGPVVVPVNYSVVDETVVFRTDSGTTPAQTSGHRVGFEVDRIDDVLSQGWSVLVRGRAHAVTDPDEVHRLAEQAHSTPWAGGRRDLWIRIEPDTVTGRRITV